MLYRQLNITLDGKPLEDALRRLQAFAAKYAWVNEINWIKANTAILSFHKDGNAFVVDGYLVMVDTVAPWYSLDEVLQEWLVLKLYDGGSVNSIPPALLAIAKSRGCKTVISADSSPISIVSKAYEDAGFLPLTRSYFKEVPNGGH